MERDEECTSHGDTWFDRTLCLEPCGVMHDRCVRCGIAVDVCRIDDSALRFMYEP